MELLINTKKTALSLPVDCTVLVGRGPTALYNELFSTNMQIIHLFLGFNG